MSKSKSIMSPRYTVTTVQEGKHKVISQTEPESDPEDPRIEGHRKSVQTFWGDKQESKQSRRVTISDFLNTFHGPQPGVRDKEKKANLGVILGVFLPNVQNVFGILMFLRLYWIVGVAGVIESFSMVFVCCMCTFLTSISVSAIATNGVIQAGGPYFLISRNLGPGVGAGVGLLFFAANAVATSMYVAGAIEILIKYMAPGLPVFMQTDVIVDMANSTRAYGTGLMIILFLLLSIGVKYVQMFAPVSLAGVLVSVVAIYCGSFTVGEGRPIEICLVDQRLLRYHMWNNDTTAMCHSRPDGLLYKYFCGNATVNETGVSCEKFLDTVESRNGFPGFKSGVIHKNWESRYNDKPQEKSDQFMYQKIRTTFFILLAIYFPSVTGIMTGCNMSGDLKNPQRDIPRGTIGAQLFTTFVYLSFVIIFGGCIDNELLRDQYGDAVDGGHDPKGNVRGGGMIIAYFAWPPTKWIVQIGAFTSTFGAAIQSLVSAPRLLQAIAKDDVVPAVRWFAKLRKNGEPWVALCLTCFIAELFLLFGDVDPIAQILGYFFLMCYCFINVSCAVQTIVGAPNWRPRYKYYHWSLSVAGALLNFFVMVAAVWYYALIVFVLWGLINVYVHYKGAKTEWGTGLRGLALTTAQQSLLCFEDHEVHPKNWRPQFLIMLKPNDVANVNDWKGVDSPPLREQKKGVQVLQFVRQLRSGKGLTIAVCVLDGKVTSPNDQAKAKAVKQVVKEIMRKTKVQGFTNIVIDSSDGSAVGTMLQTFGIGGLRPNTLVVGWPQSVIAQVSQGTQVKKPSAENRMKDFNILWDCLQCAASGGMAILIVKGFGLFPAGKQQKSGTIDVWWIMEDGGLLMLLPFLLRKSRNWKRCCIRVFAITSENEDAAKGKMKEALSKWCYDLRIDAEVNIVTLAQEAIGDYVAERTLAMQERMKLVRQLHMTKSETVKNPQLVMDAARLQQGKVHPPVMHGTSELDTITNVSLRSLESAEFKKGTERFDPELKSLREKFITDVKPKTGKVPAETPTRKPSGMDPSRNGEGEGKAKFDRLSPLLASDPQTKSKRSKAVPLLKSTPPTPPPSRRTESEDAAAPPSSISETETKFAVAAHLNRVIKAQSYDADLIVVNMPTLPTSKWGFVRFISYLETMCEGLERVLLVKGTGKEVITIYS